MCLKWISTSPAASAPAAKDGRNGRIPTAAAMPMPWKMSKARCTVLYRESSVTIDERAGRARAHGRVSSGGGLTRRPRSTARDIERYAALFAERTKVMKSSAMRDLMALTERDDVISLAGGLPDTSTFPPDSYAALMSTVAVDSCARALQYGPTEGLERRQALHRRGDGAPRASRSTPTSCWSRRGGQQVIDLVCKTLIDPGDVVVTEAPTYPGAVPTFCAYQADVVQVTMDRDGMRIDELASDARRSSSAAGRRPKFIYTVPNFHNPAGVTLSLERRRELVRIAAERELLVLEDNPYGLLRYEGDAAADAALAGRRVRDLRQHLLEDPLARRAARLDGRARAGARRR